jgi:hypothetical protein
MLHHHLCGVPRHRRDSVASTQCFLRNMRADFSGCAVDDDVEGIVGVPDTCV